MCQIQCVCICRCISMRICMYVCMYVSVCVCVCGNMCVIKTDLIVHLIASCNAGTLITSTRVDCYL